MTTVTDAIRAMPLSEILAIKAQNNDAYDQQAIEFAQSLSRPGELEVDEITITSRGNDSDGCYVLAWVWVDHADMFGEPEEVQY